MGIDKIRGCFGKIKDFFTKDEGTRVTFQNRTYTFQRGKTWERLHPNKFFDNLEYLGGFAINAFKDLVGIEATVINSNQDPDSEIESSANNAENQTTAEKTRNLSRAVLFSATHSSTTNTSDDDSTTRSSVTNRSLSQPTTVPTPAQTSPSPSTQTSTPTFSSRNSLSNSGSFSSLSSISELDHSFAANKTPESTSTLASADSQQLQNPASVTDRADGPITSSDLNRPTNEASNINSAGSMPQAAVQTPSLTPPQQPNFVPGKWIFYTPIRGRNISLLSSDNINKVPQEYREGFRQYLSSAQTPMMQTNSENTMWAYVSKKGVFKCKITTKTLGEGNYGVVYQVQTLYRSDQSLKPKQKVMKIGIEEKGKTELLRAQHVMNKIYPNGKKSPSIPGLIGYSKLKEGNEDNPYMNMDLYRGGDLFHYLQRRRDIDFHDKLQMAHTLACGASYLHKIGLGPCDIKSQNCLCDEKGNIVLSDLDSSAIYDKHEIYSKIVKIKQFLPLEGKSNKELDRFYELVDSLRYDLGFVRTWGWESVEAKQLDGEIEAYCELPGSLNEQQVLADIEGWIERAKKLDSWSFGITLTEIFFGEQSALDINFWKQDPSFVDKEITRLCRSSGLDPAVTEVLKGLLKPDPKARMSLSDAKDKLETALKQNSPPMTL
jgi:serine/threonine protein kinase